MSLPFSLKMLLLLTVCCAQSLSRVRLFVTPWTVAHQAPLSLGFSRQEYWSGFQCLPPGELPNPGIEPRSPALQAESLLSEPPGKQSESCSVVCDSLRPPGLHSPWNSPGQNNGVDSLSILQEIFPTQGLNLGLLHCRQMLYQLSHKGSPRILEWVAYPFSKGSSQPRNRTGVSCIAGRFFTNWAMREARLTISA